MAYAFELIEAKTLGSAAASISFTSIPQTFTDLYLVCSLRSARAAENDTINLTLNSASTSGRLLYGAGSGGTGTDTLPSMVISSSTSIANGFSNGTIYIPNYTSTSVYKSFSVDSAFEDNNTYAIQFLSGGVYTANTAVTSVTLASANGENLLTNSTVYLYGIKNS